MIDYVNTEIVAYSDDDPYIPTFDEAYPYILPFNYNQIYPGDVVRLFNMSLTGAVLKEGGQLAVTDPDLVGSSIYAFVIHYYNGNLYTTNYALENIGVCYYVLKEGFGEIGQYLRLTSSDVSISDPSNPFEPGNSLVVDGRDVYWLYNFGEALCSRASVVYDFLNREILGYSLISLFFGAGFFVYALYVIKNFVI